MSRILSRTPVCLLLVASCALLSVGCPKKDDVPDTVPVLIGQLPLEHLDLVVDTRNRALIGNPAHGGEHMYELY